MFLDLTAKEKSRFSITRLVKAQLTPNPRAAAPFEFECADTIRGKAGPSMYGGVAIPDDILYGQRVMITGTGAQGGYLKPTDTPTFQAAAREVSWLEKVPLQRWTNLIADQAVPRHASNVSVTWLADETSTATLQTPSFGNVGLAPKHCCIVVERSRHHLIQSPQQDEQLLRELGLSNGVAVASGAANGAGTSGEINGALSQVSQSVSGTTLSWANVCEMVKLVEAGGGADNMTALVGPTAAKTLRTREKSTGSGFILQGGKLGDVPAIVTSTMPADALLVGNFSYSIFASWGPTVELVVTDKASAAAFQSQLVSIRAITSCDFGIVHPLAFAKSVSIT